MLREFQEKEKDGIVIAVDTRRGKVIADKNDMVTVVKSNDGRYPRRSTMVLEIFEENFEEKRNV